MKLIAAPTREQGQEFVIVLVKDHVIHSAGERNEVLVASQRQFGVRAALLGETQHETYGPPGSVRWLEGVSIEQLPWREFTIS
jgi:hypothetical protein